MKSILSDICCYVNDKIPISDINVYNYVSTENLQPNRGGLLKAEYLPSISQIQRYDAGDVLVSNIRPYFKKIWYAKGRGGCSNDVLVFRAKEGVDSLFLYYVLSADAFFKYVSGRPKGTKMPRGDKMAIMKYPIYSFDLAKQRKIAKVLGGLDDKITLNNSINANLLQQLKTLYNYWFLQFDFPDENKKPYRSSKGQMAWCEKLKKEIPKGWQCKNIRDITSITWGQCPEGENILDKSAQGENLFDYCSGAGDMKGGFLVDCQAKTDNSRRFAHKNDILVSIAGKIGDMCVVDHTISLGRAAMAYTANNRIETPFIYMVLIMLNKKIQKISTGSIQKVISNDNIDDFIFPYSNVIVSQFGEVATEIFQELMLISQENIELIKLRDWLLPMFMNGQAVVED